MLFRHTKIALFQLNGIIAKLKKQKDTTFINGDPTPVSAWLERGERENCRGGEALKGENENVIIAIG